MGVVAANLMFRKLYIYQTICLAILMLCISQGCSADSGKEAVNMDELKKIIKNLKAGQEFEGDVEQFVSGDQPDQDALKQLQEALSGTEGDAREMILDVIIEIGKAVDPLYEEGGELIRDRSVLNILIEDGLSQKGPARNLVMNTLQYSVPPVLLNQSGDKLTANLQAMPDPTLFVILAKAKPKQAKPVVEKFMENRRWAESTEARIASAALGNTELEQKFISQFLNENNPEKKAEYARYLGFIGTEPALKALASEMRTDLVIENPDVTIRSVRIFIIEALSYNYPEKEFLWDNAVMEDEDYARIERFCEETFGTIWTKERPPFLWIQGFPSEPPPQ